MKDHQGNVIEKKPWYVTTTDTFMSGWGPARDKTNKLILGCDSYDEAEQVAIHAKKKSDQIYVFVRNTPPYNLLKDWYFTQYKNREDMSAWYPKAEAWREE